MYKLKTSIRKVGGSLYCLIPSVIVKELDLIDETEVLVEFERFRDLVKEECLRFCESGEKATLTTLDGKKIIGKVAFVDKKSLTLMTEDGANYIPFVLIKSIKNGGK